MASRDMESRMLRATLDEMSQVGLCFLEAMLPDSKRSAVSDAGKRMGKSEPYVARYRSRLIERGAIAPMGRGYVAFALPGWPTTFPPTSRASGSAHHLARRELAKAH